MKTRDERSSHSSTTATMVTGGAGFVGQEVVRQLAESGRTVVALYHHKLPDSLENVYPVGSDMSSPELLAAPLRGIDTVVHLAWEGGLAGPTEKIPIKSHHQEKLSKNAQIVKNLVLAMERAGTKRIVFLSAAGASRHAEVPFLREKYVSECIVLNSKIPEKIVIRSSIAFGGQGNSDRFLKSIMRVMKYPVYPVPSKTLSLSPIHLQDLASVLAAACKQPMHDEAAVFSIQGGENYKVQDLFKIVSARCVKGTRIALPSFIGAPLMPLFERDGGGDSSIPKLSHFLAIGERSDVKPQNEPDFTPMIPRKMANFRERIAGS